MGGGADMHESMISLEMRSFLLKIISVLIRLENYWVRYCTPFKIKKMKKQTKPCPQVGLNFTFNSYLQGKIGKRRLMRSPRNSLETGEVIAYPEDGADIYLTINPCLQAIAEEEIERGVKKARQRQDG